MTAYIVPQGYYVYTHHRTTTGEIFYVGMGHKRRAWDNAKRGKHWKALVAKHGRTVSIVESELQHSEAAELERKLIALHGRKDLGLGPLVNYTDGGDGAPGTVVSKELAARRGVAISKALKKKWATEPHPGKGRRHSAETKSKLSKIKKDNLKVEHLRQYMGRGFAPHEMHTPAGRAKLSATRIKMYATGELIPHNQKAVRMLTTGLEFSSANVAVKWLRVNGFPKATHGTIGKTCRGEQTKAYGSGWEFADGSSPPKYVPKEGGAPKRWVLREIDYRPFPSLTKAAEDAQENGYPKATTASIWAACNGKQKTAYGSTWRYFDPAHPL